MEKIREELLKLQMLKINTEKLDLGDKRLSRFYKSRDSFLTKINFILISKNTLHSTLKNKREELEKVYLKKPEREQRNLYFATQDLATYTLENFIYHLLSSLDNLTNVISFFYTDLNPTNTMRDLYKTIQKDNRLKDKKIYDFTKNINYHWLVANNKREDSCLYNYRANIYHNISEMCNSGSKVSWTPENFEIKLMIKIPKELLNLKEQKKIEIEDFADLLWEDYKRYILDLLDVVIMDYSSNPHINGRSPLKAKRTKSKVKDFTN